MHIFTLTIDNTGVLILITTYISSIDKLYQFLFREYEKVQNAPRQFFV